MNDGGKENAMIAQASIADRALFAGLLGSLSALAVFGRVWGRHQTATPERIRSHPLIAPRASPNRVST